MGKVLSTYAGKIGYFEVNHLAGHVIKNEEDLSIAEALPHSNSMIY